jgi:hypothetical protein
MSDQQRFEKLRNHLRAFDDPALGAEDYETAAEMHNRCRSRGVAGSAIDFLLCAVAELRQWQIFTTDREFERYQRGAGLETVCCVSGGNICAELKLRGYRDPNDSCYRRRSCESMNGAR